MECCNMGEIENDSFILCNTASVKSLQIPTDNPFQKFDFVWVNMFFTIWLLGNWLVVFSGYVNYVERLEIVLLGIDFQIICLTF